MIVSMYIFRILLFSFFVWMGGTSSSFGSDLDSPNEPQSKEAIGEVTKENASVSSVSRRKVINFNLGEKKGELGILTSWLPDQNDNLTEVVEGPAAMTLDEAGKIYFLDSIREQVQIFDSDGQFLSAKPLPRMGEDFEHSYTDIEIYQGFFLILDTQNYVIAKMSLGGAGLDEFYKIPEVIDGSMPLIVDEFNISPLGEILVLNRYDGSIYQLIPAKNEEKSYRVEKVVHTPPFRAFLGLDSHKRVIGQEFNQDNPSIIDLFRWKSGDTAPEKLFSLPPTPNLFMVDTIGMVDGDPVIAVFTGGEEKVRLSEILRYKTDGTLITKVKMNTRELPWNMNQRYHVFKNYVLLCEYRNFGKRLRIMRYTL